MTTSSQSVTPLMVADFSTYPIGRDDDDSDFNGAKFRRDWLVPALRHAIEVNGKLHVSFRGVLSFGSSFLEEAFAGLISKEGFAKEIVQRTLVIDVDAGDPDRYDGIIYRLIKEAVPTN